MTFVQVSCSNVATARSSPSAEADAARLGDVFTRLELPVSDDIHRRVRVVPAVPVTDPTRSPF